MPTPNKPTLDYSYSAFQQSQGNNTFPGTFLDNDLIGLKDSIDQTIDFVAGVIRDDGKLNAGVVTVQSLDESVLLGVASPRPWAAAMVYAVNATVTINNSIYICIVAHTATVFATDLANGRWGLVAEFTVPAAIADGAVTTTKIADAAVVSTKLANGAVTSAKIAPGAVSFGEIAAGVQAYFVPIGAEMPYAGVLAPPGWLFEFGQAVSRVAYQNLFNILCPSFTGVVTNGSPTITTASLNFVGLGIEGSRVEGPGIPSNAFVASVTASTITLTVNATASAASAALRVFPFGNGDASTTFNLPDGRDYALVGRGNMGGVTAGRISTAGVGAPNMNSNRLGGAGGVDRHTLTEAQLALHDHAVSIADTGHQHTETGAINQNVGASGGGTPITAAVATPALTTTSPTGIVVDIAPTGGGQAHPNLPPSRATNVIIFTGVI